MAEGLPYLQLAANFLDSEEAAAFLAAIDSTDQDDAWMLVRFLLWMIANRPFGDIRGLAPAVMDAKSGWKGEPGGFLRALEDAGLLVDEVAFDIEMRRFRGWGKRYDAALRKRIRDKARAEAKRRGDVAATDGDVAGKSRRVAATSRRQIATRGARGEETRPEETREDPSPAAPGDEQEAEGLPVKAARLETILGFRPDGATFCGKRRDGARTILEIWAGEFRFVETAGEYRDDLHTPSGGVLAECQYAWDHKARAGKKNKILYLQGWLARSEKRLKAEWDRRPENRPRFNETPGDGRTRAAVETQRAHERRNPAYVDPATLALQAIEAARENDDADAAGEGLALLPHRRAREGPPAARVIAALTPAPHHGEPTR